MLFDLKKKQVLRRHNIAISPEQFSYIFRWMNEFMPKPKNTETETANCN